MHRKFPLICTLVAWLFATGAQWELVQAFAWAQMFSRNIQVLPFSAAVKRTFSPEGRCEMCGAVSAAKQQQADENSAAPGGSGESKAPLLIPTATTFAIAAPASSFLAPHDFSPLSVGRAAPPLPPPRC